MPVTLEQFRQRLVAIKALPKALAKDEAAIQRYQREVEAAARLHHPNIIVAHENEESGGMHFLVMKYVAWSDLSAAVRSSKSAGRGRKIGFRVAVE